jgi:ankyrin repeat protein
MAAAVAARRAAAPPEVRAVLDGAFANLSDEHRRLAPVVVRWLVCAHAAAHGDVATKRLGRLVLGVEEFAVNMGWAEVWAAYKAGLRELLQALGAPLGEAFARDGLRASLGGLTLPLHALVTAERVRCAAAGRAFELRSDIAGIVPVPAAWSFDAPAARQRHERVFMHMLKMIAMALNERFHGMMRGVLGPHVVANEGVMAKNADGSWRLTPEKGVARMECKRVTDHGSAPGCRPALNIDVLRIIGVCETPDHLREAMGDLSAQFEGCARVKNGFATDDDKAAAGFNLRAMMSNFAVDFDCTFAQLAARPGVAEMWAGHVETSVPEGWAPRGRWRAEAAAALVVLAGAEFAQKPVVFICEAQMLLLPTYEVRGHMHEPYKGFRADSCHLLHADMLGETHKVAREAQLAADGDTALKAACRDGDSDAAAPLLTAAAPPERDAAFIVACARGREALLAALPLLAQGGSASRAWEAAWRRAAELDAALEMRAGVVEALLEGSAELLDGVDHRPDDDATADTALLRSARGGHELAVCRLLEEGAELNQTTSNGATPLYVAAQNGHEAVVRRLVSAGAALDQASNAGTTPLLIAAQDGHDTVVGTLVSAGAALDLALGDGTTPLSMAAQKGHEAVVDCLVSAGAELDLARNTDGATPLYMAAQFGHEAVVRRLLDEGAAPDLADSDGATPLLIAAQDGHAAVVNCLVSAGAALGMANANHSSPLGMAAAAGHAAVVELLLAAGANVAHTDRWGDTPLGEAKANGHEAAMAMLRAAGAVEPSSSDDNSCSSSDSDSEGEEVGEEA